MFRCLRSVQWDGQAVRADNEAVFEVESHLDVLPDFKTKLPGLSG